MGQQRRILGAACIATIGLCTVLATSSYAATQPTTAQRIATNWTTFFNGHTSASKKVALLQDGTKFSAIIKSQSSSPLAVGASAAAVRVANVKSTSAQVHYNVDISGQVALSNQSGEAVLQNGIWKVSDASFCVLLALEQTKSSSCPKT